MTYTASTSKTANTTRASNFGGLRTDGNRVALTGNTGNSMQSKDATASPVYSPISNGSGSGFALTVPLNAVSIVINSSVTCQVGEDSTYTYGFTIPASTTTEFEIADQAFIYLKPSNGTNTIQFYFKII